MSKLSISNAVGNLMNTGGGALSEAANPIAAGFNKTFVGAGEGQSSDLMHSGAMNSLSSLGGILGGQGGRAPHSLSAAAGDIANYMESTGKPTLDTDELQNMAASKGPDGSGSVPEKVAEAAAFILAGPKGASGESKRWEKTETADVGGADGLSGLGNFQQMAARGGLSQGVGAQQGGGIPQGFLKALGEMAQAQSDMRQAMEQQLMSAIGNMLQSMQSMQSMRSMGGMPGLGTLGQQSPLGQNMGGPFGSGMGAGPAMNPMMGVNKTPIHEL